LTSPKPKILICDDDEDVLLITKKILSSQDNYSIFTVTTGRECLNFIETLKPDLTLLDIHLPDILGTKVCKIIKQNERFSEVGIFLTSGMAKSIDDHVVSLAMGADDYLTRPIDKRVLLARVEAHLRLKNSEDQRKEAERRLSTFVELSQDIILTLDKEWKIINLNSSFERRLGYKIGDWLQRNFSNLIPSNFRDEWLRTAEKLANAEVSNNLDIKLLDANNVIKQFELSYSLVQVFEKIVGYIFIIKDVGIISELQAEIKKRDKSSIESNVREDSSLESLSKDTTSLTGAIYESSRLVKAFPAIFAEMVDNYHSILDFRAEERVFNVQNKSTEKIKELSNNLGFLKVSPKDVIDIHKKVLLTISNNNNSKKAVIYREEARIILIELMGYLISYYRNLS
jgi:PAS domain S-box-containing protein